MFVMSDERICVKYQSAKIEVVLRLCPIFSNGDIYIKLKYQDIN